MYVDKVSTLLLSRWTKNVGMTIALVMSALDRKRLGRAIPTTRKGHSHLACLTVTNVAQRVTQFASSKIGCQAHLSSSEMRPAVSDAMTGIVRLRRGRCAPRTRRGPTSARRQYDGFQVTGP